MGGFGFVCPVPGMWACGLCLFACPGLWVLFAWLLVMVEPVCGYLVLCIR